MQKIEFGSTGLVIEKNGFGCLPIQRISETEAVKLLHKALRHSHRYLPVPLPIS